MYDDGLRGNPLEYSPKIQTAISLHESHSTWEFTFSKCRCSNLMSEINRVALLEVLTALFANLYSRRDDVLRPLFVA